MSGNRDHASGIGLGITGITLSDSPNVAGASMKARLPARGRDSLESELTSSSRSTTQSWYTVTRGGPEHLFPTTLAERNLRGGGGPASADSWSPRSARSLGQPTWKAEKLWDVDPEKLDDEQFEVLGALLPVVAAERSLKGGRQPDEVATSAKLRSFHSPKEAHRQATLPRSPPSSPRVETSLKPRSSFASLQSFVDRPLPPLPLGHGSTALSRPHAFSFNSTPPLCHDGGESALSQRLGAVEVGELGGQRQWGERRMERATGGQPSVRKPPTYERGSLVASNGGMASPKPEERDFVPRNELDEEAHDEFAIAFLQTPPPTPPQSAMTQRSITRHTVQSPFFPVQSVCARGVPLHSPPTSPPLVPLPAVPARSHSNC